MNIEDELFEQKNYLNLKAVLSGMVWQSCRDGMEAEMIIRALKKTAEFVERLDDHEDEEE